MPIRAQASSQEEDEGVEVDVAAEVEAGEADQHSSAPRAITYAKS
jgi:hypothetical protein